MQRGSFLAFLLLGVLAAANPSALGQDKQKDPPKNLITKELSRPSTPAWPIWRPSKLRTAPGEPTSSRATSALPVWPGWRFWRAVINPQGAAQRRPQQGRYLSPESGKQNGSRVLAKRQGGSRAHVRPRFRRPLPGRGPRHHCRQKKLQERAHDLLVRAVQLMKSAQNREGGWRYQPKPADADLTVTVCQLQALQAVRDAGIAVRRMW